MSSSFLAAYPEALLGRSHRTQIHGIFPGLLFDGGSRGLPRSDRRASVFAIKELLLERILRISACSASPGVYRHSPYTLRDAENTEADDISKTNLLEQLFQELKNFRIVAST
jgi:hypothetical protein